MFLGWEKSGRLHRQAGTEVAAAILHHGCGRGCSHRGLGRGGGAGLSPAAALVGDLSAAAAPLADLLTATASELTGAAVVLWNGEAGSDLASPAAAL